MFHDLDKFPYNVGLGQRVRENFMAPFLRLALEPQGPRDQLLRGDFDKAAADLVSFSARMEQQQKRRAEAGSDEELEDRGGRLGGKAVAAYADQIRAQENGTPEEREQADKAVDEVWKDSGSVRTLLEGASCVAGPGRGDLPAGSVQAREGGAGAGAAGAAAARAGAKVPALEVEDVNDGVDGRPGLVEEVRRRPPARE